SYFNQFDGSTNVGGRLVIDGSTAGRAADPYFLLNSSVTLTAATVDILDNANFTHVHGTHVVGTLNIGVPGSASKGRYFLQNGTLTPAIVNLNDSGVFSFSGGSITSGGMFNNRGRI